MTTFASPRRWFQYRLRTLLLAIALAALPLAWLHSHLESARAVEFLRDRGAIIRDTPDGLVVQIEEVPGGRKQRGWTGSPTDLDRLRHLGAIQELHIRMTFTGPENLAFLEEVEGLRCLGITARGEPDWRGQLGKRMAVCRELETLLVSSRNLENESLQGLEDLKMLKMLGVRHVGALSRSSLDTICKIESLERFIGIVRNATDEDLKKFLALPRLRTIRIQSGSMSLAGLNWLRQNHPTCTSALPVYPLEVVYSLHGKPSLYARGMKPHRMNVNHSQSFKPSLYAEWMKRQRRTTP
ncbi:MAG: hypothetical protein DWQ31_14730 [Planctomycetota bacterium]|nr:MAG: hypothetical protein DWQ31_14730 [Planctomycetota bacterium]REJ88608.1 MAG: hypothetical protein DWQ35_19605 [Planctomycetota bacterium]REK31593.1 MAG: hypothetical protein DWQ42_00195 [Planctomycetota bacterium]REK48751.1 MAG: hypothetical protein DWQ46_01590 [Planctomycetota bacterium]